MLRRFVGSNTKLFTNLLTISKHFTVKNLGVNCAKFLFYATEIQYVGYPVLFYFIPAFNINSSNKL